MGRTVEQRARFALRSPNFLFCAALIIEAAVFHWRALFLPGYLFPWDFRAVHVPFAMFVADSIQRGEFPLWDPYTYCGYPIFANIQAALFYPPVLAATALGSWLGVELIPKLLVIAEVAQVAFAGLCTFALARRIGARPAAAWIAATVYELGCFFASQPQHMGAMHGASWLPLIWLCVVELGQGLKWAWLAALSFALSMTVLAGLPQVAVAAFGSALLLSVAMAIFKQGDWSGPVRVLLGWVWGLLLAAVQVIPTYELTQNSVAKYRDEWLKTGGGMDPGALWSLIIPNYWSVFDLSKFHGPTDPTFLYLYSSIAGLALALAALMWKPDSWRRVFGLVTLVAAVAMLGDNTPIGRAVLATLPVRIRIGIHPEYIFCAFSLGLSVLAGLGANRFLRSTRVQIAAGILIACDLILVSSGRIMNTNSTAAEPGIARNAADGSVELVSRLRALTGSTVPPSRFDMRPEVSYVWSSSAPILAIPTSNGCDPLAPERMIQVRLSFAPGERWGTCYQAFDVTSPVLNLVNARGLLSREPVANPNFRLVSEAAGYKLYENISVLPRFFFVGRIEFARDLAEAARLLHRPDFQPADTAIVEAPSEPFGELSAEPSTGINVIDYAPSRLILETHTAAPSFLVVTEAWYPGWEATIDGQPARLYITDVAFRGLRVPAGDHRIEMRFVPRILFWSGGISIAALLAMVLVLARSRRISVRAREQAKAAATMS
ncbi:MAG: hypothetical protein ACM3S5_12335 [Rhodospirillales bacterium]